ncbi:MAG: SUMF1/EgtB/PvdO family nonheme iron enzyme [Planctomycetes bacterium]|nr:SUMF1/EgtB/PvdO family nonheme iron enzyme [Planctomycetota bacterium]
MTEPASSPGRPPDTTPSSSGSEPPPPPPPPPAGPSSSSATQLPDLGCQTTVVCASEGGSTRFPANAQPGDVIGVFRVLRELWRGGMGVVYLAEEPALGRTVALKILPLVPSVSNEQALERFEREARATASLSHPHVVGIHSVGQAPGCRYIAMDYVPGLPLDHVQRVSRMGPARAARILWQAALGLAKAHEAGVVHRDVKPSNLLVECRAFGGSSGLLAARERAALEEATRAWPAWSRQPGGQAGTGGAAEAEAEAEAAALREDFVRVTDFGLARTRASHQLTMEGDIMGTPNYMSPEQTLGKSRDAGPPADVYSLGATLYELLAGRPPFQAAGTLQLFFSIQTVEPVRLRRLNPRVDLDLETVVLRCLEKEPERRYPDAGALAADLRRWMDDVPVLARRPSVLEREWRRVARNPVPHVLGFALALLAGSIAAYAVVAAWAKAGRLQGALAAAERALAVDDLPAAERELAKAAACAEHDPRVGLLRNRLERGQGVSRALDAARRGAEAVATARGRARALQDERARILAALPAGAGVEARAALWLVEDELEEAATSARAGREAEATALATTLALDPGHADARDRLLALAGAAWFTAEEAGDLQGCRHWEARLRDAGGEEFLRSLRRPVQFTLRTRPAEAQVFALRYVEVGRLLLPVPLEEAATAPALLVERLGALDPAHADGTRGPTPGTLLGTTSADPRTGLLSVELPPGAYLLQVERWGRETLRLPLRLLPGRPIEAELTLPAAGSTPAGFVRIPVGPGGGAAVPEFCMARLEVTCAEYLEFLNDPATLAEVTRPDGRIRRVPRTAPGEGALWPRGADRRFALPAGVRPERAVASIDLDDARAYARWFDRRRPDPAWRFDLPSASEWEKAASGADGRAYPWGNGFDPSLCRMRDAGATGPGPVGTLPADESPYGVRDLAGNVAEWTLTGNDEEGWAVKGGSWTSDGSWCRTASRDLDMGWEIDDENGIRLVAHPR